MIGLIVFGPHILESISNRAIGLVYIVTSWFVVSWHPWFDVTITCMLYIESVPDWLSGNDMIGLLLMLLSIFTPQFDVTLQLYVKLFPTDVFPSACISSFAQLVLGVVVSCANGLG